MKIIKKRIFAFLLSVYMVFGVVSTDYLTVQAFEWVVPSLTVGESLLWLMGLLGMTYTEGASAWRDVSPEYEQEFIDYANEHGLTYTETSTWLNDTASGKLNQLSEVWTSFKEWVKSKISSSSNFDSMPYSSAISQLNRTFSLDIPIESKFENFTIYAIAIQQNTNNKGMSIFLYTSNNFDYSTLFTLSGSSLLVSAVSSTILIQMNTNTGSFANSNVVSSSQSFSGTNFNIIVTPNLINNVLSNYIYTVLNFGGETDSDFNVYNPALIPDINFAGANTEDASIPGVIDLPWGNLGHDVEERDKTYDDLVGGLDLGKEIGDLWQALQDLMGVLAVDDAGVLQPNSGGDNPPTLEDEAENNKVNGAFVLTGLQKVFPFCIPFDLYAFITLLEAPPVAPIIQYPIYNPVTKSNEIITIDFSTWESVVVLFRYIFDFLFIIGLLLMARALIGGGDSA